jgi:DMSO/TMAO reductase YedYZ molybdopterin-dependent catalytic subunit
MSAITNSDSLEPFSDSFPEHPEFERDAFIRLDPPGFHIRNPPPPHDLDTYITPDDKLFQTTHMGHAMIDPSRYRIVVDGLVDHPITLTLSNLHSMPQTSITSFHECFGSPLKPPIERCCRIGNVVWSGVKVSHILSLAGLPATTSSLYLWTSGLDRGTFNDTYADAYTKDLPLSKALSHEVIIAHSMNGAPLSKERGAPARLVVPGYFGTNSVKWVCRFEVRDSRAQGPYTTKWYNEIQSNDEVKPVWGVEVNSVIVRPRAGEVVKGRELQVEGWAWSEDGVKSMRVSGDGGMTWQEADVHEREGLGWQKFDVWVVVEKGRCEIIARAMCKKRNVQPMEGRRNCVHRVEVVVEEAD